MRPIVVFPSVIHAMRPDLDVTAPQGRDPPGKINSEETSRVGAPPLWQPHQSRYSSSPILNIHHLLVSRSSWFLKSVTVLLSSRAAAWTESTRSLFCFVALASASSSTLSSLTELLVACMSAHSSNAGVSTESTASLTAEATTESKVLCCSLSASLTPLAIAPSRSSLEMVESLNLWRLTNLSFPIALNCRSTHDGSNAEWFEIYWQDNKIFDRVCRVKDYACIAVEGSRDLPR